MLKNIHSNRIYQIILISTVLGFITPIISLFSKLKSRTNWLNEIKEFIDNEQIISILNYISLIVPSWHYENSGLAAFHYYIKWSIYNLLILTLIILCRKKLLIIISRIKNLYKNNTIILSAIILCIFVFNSKVFLGFYFSGIPGWDYSNNRGFGSSSWGERQYISKQYIKKDKLIVDQKLQNLLLKGVNLQNAKNILTNTSIRGVVIVAHTVDAQYCINDGISGIVFPHRYVENNNKGPWLDIINYRLNKQKKYNTIWKKLRYPDHTVYMDIDEGIYNERENLIKIEYWDVEVTEIEDNIHITDAKLIYLHD